MQDFNIEYKFDIKEQHEDEKYFYFSGYGSTKDKDLVDDIVEPTAFDDSLKEVMPKMLWQHDRTQPIGIYTEARPDNDGLFVKGMLPKDDTFVVGRVIPQLKIKSIDSLSIGFRVKESEWNRDTNVRTIKKADLMEISLVTFPANPKARITALKAWAHGEDEESKTVNSRGTLPKSFADRAYRWDSSAADKRVRTWAGATEAPNAKYRSAFLWYDGENEDKFTAYKLQIADVVSGAIKIIPRAVFAVRGVLSGARGGVDIPEADKTKIKGIVNALYKEMELEEPFKADGTVQPYCKSEIKGLTKGILSDIIRYDKLSKDAADYVADVVLADCYGEIPDESALESLLKTIDNFKLTRG